MPCPSTETLEAFPQELQLKAPADLAASKKRFNNTHYSVIESDDSALNPDGPNELRLDIDSQDEIKPDYLGGDKWPHKHMSIVKVGASMSLPELTEEGNSLESTGERCAEHRQIMRQLNLNIQSTMASDLLMASSSCDDLKRQLDSVLVVSKN